MVVLGVEGEALGDGEAVAEVAVAFEEAGEVVEEAGRWVSIIKTSECVYVSAALVAQSPRTRTNLLAKLLTCITTGPCVCGKNVLYPNCYLS